MKIFSENDYFTPDKKVNVCKRLFPSLGFYLPMIGVVFSAANLAKRGLYDNERWIRSSWDILRHLESVGVKIEVKNRRAFKGLKGPCVFIGNHMSTLETFVLPGMIQNLIDVTFIVKKGLIEYPVFKHVMISRDPIVVSRDNPREDFKAVMGKGQELLKRGISIIVFPQTTRSSTLVPEKFNTIGVKLAQRAAVPVVPIAVKTDAWGVGKLLKEFGSIRTDRKVYIHFGEPIPAGGNPKEVHREVIQFIAGKLRNWEQIGVQVEKKEMI